MNKALAYVLAAWVVIVLANAGQLPEVITAIFNGLNSCSAQVPTGNG